MNWNKVLIVGTVFIAVLAGTTVAQSETLARPTVIVAPQASVKGKVITLGAIAQISAPAPQHAALVGQLKGLVVSDSPAPGTTTTLLAPNILDQISKAGIAPDTIGYSIPNSVTIQREGRAVSADEVLKVAREVVQADKSLDIQVREVTWAHDQLVPVGVTTIALDRLGAPRGGKIPLRVDVTVDGEPAARFLATALVDDWREVPVLGRTVERGRMISPEDIQVVRLNLFRQPDDLIETLDELIGRRALSTIQPGETIRKRMIELPPTIAKGKRITMSFGSGPFFATATGVALEDGLEGGVIRVKNESSGKIVRGKIINPDEVEVELR